LGVPGWRPPRLSPGFDPLGIAVFTLFLSEELLTQRDASDCGEQAKLLELLRKA